MCNRYGNHVSYQQYVASLKTAKIELVSPTSDRAPNLEPRDNIFPTEKAPILRPLSGGLELLEMRWGLIPNFHTKSVKEWKFLNTNARGETIDTKQSFQMAFRKNRCLIPASVYYEWTGEKNKKTKWSFTSKGEDWFCLAGIWHRAYTTDGALESFAMVTVAAKEATLPYHDRQPLLLKKDQYEGWLGDFEEAKRIILSSQENELLIEEATV